MLKKQLSHLPFCILILFITGYSEYSSQHIRGDNRVIYREQSEVAEIDIQGRTHARGIQGQHAEYSRRERYLVDSNDVLDIVVFEDPGLSREEILSSLDIIHMIRYIFSFSLDIV